ncbi:MAG: PIG-L deacetylase family protein [Kiritimatiellia bacterium]
MKDLRVLAIGAHPDDPDLNMGATAARLAASGATVRFLSMTNGDKGHATEFGPALAARRRREAAAAAAKLGIVGYDILAHPDCGLEATLENRRELTRYVRAFAPHVIVTHRSCDYHADHRATGTLVCDAAYLLCVPGWCPDAPVPGIDPIVLTMRDRFTCPREMRADVAVDATPVANQVADALACHVSQLFEWLVPQLRGAAEAMPADRSDVEAVRAYIRRFWFERKVFDAQRFGLPFKYAEVFEVSEYGRTPTREELRAIFPEGTLIGEQAAGG